MDKFFSYYNSPLGKMVAVSDGNNLTALYFVGQQKVTYDLSLLKEKAPLNVFDDTFKWLDTYFGGSVPDFLPDIDLSACSVFGKQVIVRLLKIPYGEVTTYGNIAKDIERETGKRVSCQAVGGAVGRNPIAIIIPCHRVIGSGGKLVGYAGGIDKKIALLKIENILPNK